VSDPDAPGGNFYHWVVVDLPAGSAGISADLPAGARELKNSGGNPDWAPPCPPSGTHHYRFTAYALSAATGLPADASLDDAFAAISRSTVAQGTLTGLVSH
jgi:Raf kinase inhibitor-like YbhB/YbcL family protein